MIMMVSARRLLNPTFPTSQATSDKRCARSYVGTRLQELIVSTYVCKYVFLLQRLVKTCDVTSNNRMPPKIAIVGGGISGAVAASRLGEAGYDVTVFDQGQRGPGTIASELEGS